MTGYIEREAFLDAIERGKKHQQDADDIAEMLQNFPAADVRPVWHGRWVKVHDEVCYWLACSVCGEEIPKRFGTDYYTNFCPNCGADMREGN